MISSDMRSMGWIACKAITIGLGNGAMLLPHPVKKPRLPSCTLVLHFALHNSSHRRYVHCRAYIAVLARPRAFYIVAFAEVYKRPAAYPHVVAPVCTTSHPRLCCIQRSAHAACCLQCHQLIRRQAAGRSGARRLCAGGRRSAVCAPCGAGPGVPRCDAGRSQRSAVRREMCLKKEVLRLQVTRGEAPGNAPAGPRKRAYIQTMGCQMNVSDSEVRCSRELYMHCAQRVICISICS
jgi:hypothetical protein